MSAARCVSLLIALAGAFIPALAGAGETDGPPESWLRSGPIDQPPAFQTAAYPLSDQANRGNWIPYAPFCDEFEASRLDPNRWVDRNPGWLGRQPAFFSEDNVRLADGKLHLTMRRQSPPEALARQGYHTYSSAAVQSRFRVLYGYFEVRARPMKSHGSSSFWFYDSAPDLWTEIDVFEIGGAAPGFETKYNMNVHVMKTPTVKEHLSNGAVWQAAEPLADAYHVYGLEWDERRITWYVDGAAVRWVNNSHWHQPLTLNFDSETMPDWFGLPRDEDLPSTYSIEYVRAWKKVDAASRPLFEDLTFQRGFLLSYPDSAHGRKVEAVLDFGEAGNRPVWRLAQWGTRFSLAGAACRKCSNGDRVYENQGKMVLAAGADSENRDVILEIRGQAEYGNTARKAGAGWPHLLVEQDARAIHPLTQLEKLPFRALLKRLRFADHMPKEDFDPARHAAQFQMFFIVKNIDARSRDFGDYFWFGVPFFDSRHDIPPAFQARDGGKADATGKFIYTIDGRVVNHLPMQTGKWITFQGDLLPFIKDGLAEAGRRGFLQDVDPAHYAVVNMNLGWEIPGTYTAAIQIRDLQIHVVLK
ncbi:MAG: family 16 glycosylhydrolase [Sedimentisphaerales bacterium]|nr:family 16 glycosylhydrolase [Sedimentisphaerales bacterium]